MHGCFARLVMNRFPQAFVRLEVDEIPGVVTRKWFDKATVVCVCGPTAWRKTMGTDEVTERYLREDRFAKIAAPAGLHEWE